MFQNPFLIVGLGNPGASYEATRHNIGFMALNKIAERYNCAAWQKKFKSMMTAHMLDPALVLLKPQTFMNLSGEAVGTAMRFYKLESENVIVFHDDLDLQPGQVKIKRGGGAGGHNGLKSIDAHIGPDYWRIRLGIGHPGVKGDVVTDYVLTAFNQRDYNWLQPLLDILAQKLDVMLKGRTAEYLNHITSQMKPVLNPPDTPIG
jgi:peptidyl-tRNA hydrolase, PTH1 family